MISKTTLSTAWLTTAVAIALPPTVPAGEARPSGKEWVAQFPGSKKVEDLDAGFQEKVRAFLKALEDAGAKVRVTSTRRPRERAYLMHWSWRVAREDHDARQVPPLPGVDIDWWHGTQEASRKKAQEMAAAYGTNGLQVAPSLTSRHIEGKAIDMVITWEGALTIRKGDGSAVRIASTPRDGTNAELIEVGKSYDVFHFKAVEKDKVHWSTDGR